jgi:ABC-2 type transport system permease protein
MSKIYTILSREYLNIVKKKSFIISAILTPVLMIGAMLIPTFFAEMTVIKERRIAVIDGTSYVLENLIQSRQTFTALVNLLDQQKAVNLSAQKQKRWECLRVNLENSCVR